MLLMYIPALHRGPIPKHPTRENAVEMKSTYGVPTQCVSICINDNTRTIASTTPGKRREYRIRENVTHNLVPLVDVRHSCSCGNVDEVGENSDVGEDAKWARAVDGVDR